MSAAFTLWLNDIRPDVPGCPIFAINAAILSAAIEFCQKTEVWTQEFNKGATVVGTADYQVTGLTAGSEIHRIKYVQAYGQEIIPASDSTLNNNPTWRTDTGIPGVYKWKYPDSITLIPSPSMASADDLIIIVVLKPTRSASSLTDLLGQPYYDAIRYGALYRLLNRRGQPWYDPQEALFSMNEFKKWIRTGKHDALTGNANTAPNMGTFA